MAKIKKNVLTRNKKKNAEKKYASNEYEEAKHLYMQVVKIDQNDIDAWEKLVEINMALGLYDEAENNCHHLIVLSPNKSRAYILSAGCMNSQGKILNALGYLQEAIKFNQNDPAIYYNIGVLQQKLGHDESAIDAYKTAIDLKPDLFAAMNNIGMILLSQKHYDEAIKYLNNAVKITQDDASIYYNLGNAYISRGSYTDAAENYKKAIRISGGHANALSSLGAAESELGEVENALSHHEKAVSIDPNNVGILYRYGKLLHDLFRYEDAIKVFNRIYGINPENQKAICGISASYEKLGKYEDALSILQPILKMDATSINADVAIILASLCNHNNSCVSAIELLKEKYEQQEGISREQKILLGFSLGKLHDSNGMYDQAFKYYTKSNALKNEEIKDIKISYEGITAAINVFSATNTQKYPRSESISNQPVFIVGMPRSGTSLVEQILASHKDVFGAGELLFIEEIAEQLSIYPECSMPYPECITEVTTKILTDESENYLNKINTLATGNPKRITNKAPGNYRYLGLIKMLFPKASIIHCVRNPLDTCLSIYFQNFGNLQPYAYDLKKIARHYCYYKKIIDHWKSIPDIEIYEIKYESLVENQEECSRNLVEHCGLEWDENCLQFHNNKRQLNTASYDQIRQPIYTKSVNRYRHYVKYIKDLENILTTIG